MANIQDAKRRPIIIAGMHRSGTSLVASVLEKAGVYIGEELLGANTSNPQGHFEDVDFLSLHQAILASQGIGSEGWTKRTKLEVSKQLGDSAQLLCTNRDRQHEIWGWKDPRSTLFLDFWKELLPEAVFVFVYRPPWEVVESLFVRGDQAFKDNPRFAVEVWTAYNQAVLDFVTQYPKCSLLTNVYALTDDENLLISQVNDKFGLNLVHLQTKLFQKDEMHSQLTSSHRPALLANFFPAALEIYQTLEEQADLPALWESHHAQSSPPLDYQDWIFQDWRSNSRLSTALKHAEAQAQRSQLELQSVRDELGVTYTALQETRAELGETYTALQEARAELGETYTALQESRTEASQLYTDSKRFYEELQITQAQLNNLQQVIASMESSKFWALRNRWFKLKEHFSKLFQVKLISGRRELEQEQ